MSNSRTAKRLARVAALYSEAEATRDDLLRCFRELFRAVATGGFTGKESVGPETGALGFGGPFHFERSLAIVELDEAQSASSLSSTPRLQSLIGVMLEDWRSTGDLPFDTFYCGGVQDEDCIVLVGWVVGSGFRFDDEIDYGNWMKFSFNEFGYVNPYVPENSRDRLFARISGSRQVEKDELEG